MLAFCLLDIPESGKKHYSSETNSFLYVFRHRADTDANLERLQMNKYGGFVCLAPRHFDRTFSCWQPTETSPTPSHCRPAMTIIRRCTLTADSSRALEMSRKCVHVCVPVRSCFFLRQIEEGQGCVFFNVTFTNCFLTNTGLFYLLLRARLFSFIYLCIKVKQIGNGLVMFLYYNIGINKKLNKKQSK